MQEVDPALGWLIVRQLIMKDMAIEQALANARELATQLEEVKRELEELRTT